MNECNVWKSELEVHSEFAFSFIPPVICSPVNPVICPSDFAKCGDGNTPCAQFIIILVLGEEGLLWDALVLTKQET